MKKRYTTFIFLIAAIVSQAQTFEFSLAYLGLSGSDNHQIALIATPNADVPNGNTADMGAVFYLPAGLTLGNYAAADSGISPSEWGTEAVGSSGGQDIISLFRTPGATNIFFNQMNGTPIQLAVFDVIATVNPMSGAITILESTDPNISFYENFLNINLGAGTGDAYSGNDPSANSINFATLSNPDIALQEQFNVYPNPAQDVLNISSNYDIERVALFTLLGKLVLTKDNSNQIQIDTLSAGVYILKVYTSIGNQTKKVIIE